MTSRKLRATALAVAFGAALCTAQDAQAAVGRTVGLAGVSASGTSGYTIPIFAPPGTNGLTPSLSLAYGSGLGSGWIGEGWAIGGLSAIARCPQTVAQDGAARGVLLDGYDRFCLDGNRLRLASGTYGTAGSTYRTEIETFARVSASGTAGSGPASFTVEQKNGLIYEYGTSSDSQVEALGSSTIREWALSRIRDRSGNTISFAYVEDATNGAYRLASVQYTSNSGQGLAAAYRIEFFYETQPGGEIDSRYFGGKVVKDIVRLTRVEVTYSGAIVRRYSVAYEASLSSAGNSRVQSIQECVGTNGTDCLGATTFTYQNGVAGLGAEVSSGVTVPATPYLPLDVNGDGRTDLVYSSSATSGSGSWMVLFANASGGFNAPVNSGIANTNFSQAIATDFNGDGLGDFLVPLSGGTWWLVQGTAMGLAGAVNTGVSATGAGGNARTMDLNGDGLDDLVYAVVTGGTHSVQARLRSGSGYAAATYVYGPVASPYAIIGPVFGTSEFSARKRNPDVNGDARADFVVHTTEYDPGMGYLHSWEVVLGGGAGVVYVGSFQIGGGPYWPDLNGDGCSDAVYTWGVYWRYRFSNCATLGPEYKGAAVSGLPQTHAVALDWDADGFDDIVGVNQTSFTIEYMRSTGEALGAPSSGQASNPTIALVTGDVNGDGLGDLLYRSAGNLAAYKPHAGVAPDLLDVVSDGFGVTQNFDYGPLTDPTLYSKYSGASFPEADLQPTRWAVKLVTATDRTGDGSSYTLGYTYEGARVNRQGRGFLGFARRITTDSRNGYNTRTEDAYLQTFPYTGLLASSTLKQASGSKLGETTNSWATLSWGPTEPRSYPYLASSVSRDYELGGTQYRSVTTAVSGISSTSGLVTDSSTTTSELATGVNAGSSRTERTWHLAVLDDTSNWCLGRPQTTQLIASHTLTDGNTITRTTGATWDGTYCRPSQLIEEPGSSTLQVTTALLYDGFGNLNSQSVTGIGLSARTTTASWGASGQFPVALTNALGQTTSRDWNYGLGLPASVADPNGLVTGWSHDSFGRRTSENRPDGTSTAWTYASCTTCGARVKYSVQEQPKTTAGVVIRTDEFHFDAFDQEVSRLTPQAAGGYARVRYDRDAFGRITRAYVPHWNGGATNGYEDTAYDVLGRNTGTATYTASGTLYRSTATAWNGLTATASDALGHSTTRVALAWGPDSRVTDAAGGSTNHLSNAYGQPTRMTDAYGTIVLQAAYNARGRPTSVTNVNRGTTTLVPNALGEVSSETTAKGHTRSYTYDSLGRLISRTEPEGTSTWTWGTGADNTASAKYIGGLKSVSGPGYSETYTNDAYGRRVTQTVSSDASYQVDFGYNALGTLDTLTYPTSTAGYRLKLQYDYTNGLPTAIKDFNAPTTVIWNRTADDARGAVIDETLGANLRVVTGRDPLTGRMDYRQAGIGGGAALQNFVWLYDANDNLTQRGDANLAGTCNVGGVLSKLCETFTYDSLDRLDTVRRNGTLTLDVDYDYTGNITSRSDLGSYTYDATKKHAVTAAGSNSFAYDANGNVTTRNGATLGWASYDLPTSLVAGGNTASFAYTPDRTRWRQIATTAGVTETTIYVAGIVEKVVKPSITLWKHYVTTPTGTGAVYVRRSDGSSDTYYLTTDQLGSTDRIVKAATGTVQVAESFDAFGKRRGSDWQGGPSAADLAAISESTPDGFTGHEMLDGVGLIHMNGRVYDPAVGRFLSVDPLVRDAAASQSWNGYGYVEGRLLSATDPTGWSTDRLGTNIQYRADPPQSSWVTSVYGTPHQHGEWQINPKTGLEDLVTTIYWSFSGPYSLAGLREPTLGAGELPVPTQLANESAEVPATPGQPGDDSKQDPRCKQLLPDGSTVNSNVRILLARLLSQATNPHSSDAEVFQTYGYWVAQVREGGRWDYKRQRGGSETIGNFNYGATGSVLLDTSTLLRAAGVVQLITLPSASDGGNPFGTPPYGDQIRDQSDILAGITGGCR